MSLKRNSALLACLLGVASGCSCLCSSERELQTSSHVDRRRVEAVCEDTIPIIHIDGVRLCDAIENLARYMQINCILDPRVPGADFNVARHSFSAQPEVHVYWENFTGQQAFHALLDMYDLKMVTNFTSVIRIVPRIKKVKLISFRPSNLQTDLVISPLVMEKVPLVEAIRRIAAQGRFNLVLDPSLSRSPFALNGLVNFRWEDVTPIEALIALLENYDLSLVEEPGTSSLRVTFEPQASPVVKL